MEETVEQKPVFKEERTEIFVDGENTMAVLYIDQLKGHRGSAFHGIFIATGRAETTVAAKRNKFEISTMRAGIHCTAERGIATVEHLIDILHLCFSGMKRIFNFFIMVSKDFL